MNIPELLAPAGTLLKLKIALSYGADAVYVAGYAFGLRAGSGNFSEKELIEAVKIVHALGKKIYITVNIFPHNEDLKILPSYLLFLEKIGVDAIIVSDLGVLSMAKDITPHLPLHISTQANSTNKLTVDAWHKLGAERVVLARELSLAEISEIREFTTAELEIFIHGSMCISYSGRCLLSNYFTGRDANRGGCAQPCRWKYRLEEEKRKGEFFPVEEDEHGTYIFNSKDLCLLPHLLDIVRSGVDSLKIEGRMKTIHYVATVTKVYHMMLDAIAKNEVHDNLIDECMRQLRKISHREYTTGFFAQKPTDAQIYGSSSYTKETDFVGLVLDYDEKTCFATVEQRNNMKSGEEIELFQPHLEGFRQILEDMRDEDGMRIEVAPHAQQIVKIFMQKPVEKYAILRRAVKN